MKKYLFYIALKILPYIDIYPSRITRRNKLKTLIKSLHPVNSDRELIRMGPNGDGGYLVPNDLEGVLACFSAGVGKSSGFEMDCAKRGMKVFLADNTVKEPPESHELFNFTKKNVGVITNSNVITIDNWVFESLPNADTELLLQMDIEGSEYEVLLSASDQLLKRFRIIVVEFHYLGEMLNSKSFDIVGGVFNKLLQSHTCVHIHPNNADKFVKYRDLIIPRTAEFTFLRNDRIENSSLSKTFPHPLDRDNTLKKSVKLPDCWYG